MRPTRGCDWKRADVCWGENFYMTEDEMVDIAKTAMTRYHRDVEYLRPQLSRLNVGVNGPCLYGWLHGTDYDRMYSCI